MILHRLRRPIVLAPLGGGPSTPQLAAAVTDAGGLGFLAGAYLTAADAGDRLRAARELTDGPLGLNLFVPGAGPADAAAHGPYVERLRAWAERAGMPVGEPRWEDDDWEAKLALAAEQAPEVVSFTFGCPSSAVIDRLRAAGSEAWVTVTSADEARRAHEAGADALVVQGAEAGGHRGSFADRPDLPAYGLLALLDLVAAAVPVPLVASGGIATGRALAAVLAAGARAAQIGTAFMLAPEAGTNAAHREALRSSRETVLTRAFTGRLARGIRNAFIEEHEAAAPIAYPEIHHLTSPLRRAARESGDESRINLWAGEAHELAREEPAADIVARLAAEARAALAAARVGADDAIPFGDERLRALAREWYAAWNDHDLDRILSHYSQDAAFSSPFIAELGIDPSGRLTGHEALRAYWSRALERFPDLRFEPLAELFGAGGITLHYRGIAGILAAETLEVGDDGLVYRAAAHYDRLP